MLVVRGGWLICGDVLLIRGSGGWLVGGGQLVSSHLCRLLSIGRLWSEVGGSSSSLEFADGGLKLPDFHFELTASFAIVDLCGGVDRCAGVSAGG